MSHPQDHLPESPVDALTAARAQAIMRYDPSSLHAHDRAGRLFVGKKIGGYGILSRISCGECCWVFLARRLRGGMNVALKVLNTDCIVNAPAGLRRFREQGYMASLLSHPQIVQTHGDDIGEGVPAVAMEHLAGFTLTDLIRALGRVSCAAVATIGAQIVRGLAYLHSRGFVHRQIEPSHIMLGADRAATVVSLSAICRHGVLETSAQPFVQGSPRRARYHPPEQAASQPADFRSDFYALGATLFEMLMGTPLVPAYAAVLSPLPPMAERLIGLGPCGAVGLITKRLLADNPAERFPSHGELLGELEFAEASR